MLVKEGHRLEDKQVTTKESGLFGDHAIVIELPPSKEVTDS